MNFSEYKTFFLDAVQALGCVDFKQHNDDIACKCPVCGDSRRGNKRRLHLYQKGDVINVNCFNGDCPVKSMSVYRFLKEHHPQTFQKFERYSRQQYLNNLIRPEEKLEVLMCEPQAWSQPFVKAEVSEAKQKLKDFILGFEPKDANDLDRIKEFLKENPECVQEFKWFMQ